ncbi:amidohydrolase family protein [Bradyrhizobium tropiciagri]|uniref:amidohydrolase n=1 Tax=Bradyrhizobium tropiciagri TaxID=312253 RepID=UPI001BAAB625|nr:amidohydrolase [Bradyrhizobium tropiciagri]MBR0873220.1 amidohydrolase family protein [Bradyrhizobium tropiciagri]
MTGRSDSIRFINGRIYRDAGDRIPVDTLVTRCGIVDFIGAQSDAPAADVTIDLRGTAVIPGLTDAHIHLFGIAAERLQLALDPRAVRSLSGLLDSVATAARRESRGYWIRGVGFDENGLPEHRYPTRDELDAAAPDCPVVIRRFCGHTAIINSAAMSALGIAEGISDPTGGSFGRDRDGRLNGIVKESAADAVFRNMPKVERALVADSLRATIADAMKLGLTAAVEAAVGFTSGFDEEHATWELLRTDRSLMRLGFMYRLDPKEALGRKLVPQQSPDWQTNTLKFFADGIVGARTAAVSAAYHDVGGTGFFMRDEQELERAIVEAHLDGWQVAVHAVGDRAISTVIAAYERAQRVKPRPEARHRIEHYTCPPEGGLARMKNVGAVVVAQPSFLSVMHRTTFEAFGPDAVTRYPARSVLDAGVPYVSSSDCPTGDFSPWVGMANAIDRGAAMGKPLGATEALSRSQTLRSYAQGGAYVTRQESWRGVLEPGMAADLIALDRDPFEPSVDLKAVKVLMTVVRGTIRHDVLGSQSSKAAGMAN